MPTKPTAEEIKKILNDFKSFCRKEGYGNLSIHDYAIQAYAKSDQWLSSLTPSSETGEDNPYSYWPQCEVDGCDGVSCNGGGCWRETGYWSVCPKHSQMFRNGDTQPKMRQSAIDREATRGADGMLPSPPTK